MALKHIVLQIATLRLWNQARAKVIASCSNKKSVSDDLALRKILKTYMGDK